MDFLDPRKIRTHRIRLMIGYGLMSIVIGLGSIVLVYGAYGFGINTKTGEIIQNGLVFADSKPGGAKIYLNGIDQDRTTAARMILQAGDYSLSLQKEGYRQWEKSFHLEEHSLARYVYPFLFPVAPESTVLKNYTALPVLVSQSPDRRWLLVQQPTVLDRVSFDVYDTDNLEKPPVLATLPTGLFTNAGLANSVLKEVAWASNNNLLLLQNTYPSGKEFIVLNRSEPARSFNINKLFNTNPDKVVLRDGKADQVYIYNQAALSLAVADTRNGQLSQPFLSGVLAFNSYEQNLVSYVTATGAPAGQVNAHIWDTDKSYPLAALPVAETYLLDADSFQGNWYYIVGSNNAPQVHVYKNPLDTLKNKPASKVSPQLALRNPGATYAGFSSNSRIIGVQSGQKLSVYDLETKDTNQFEIAPRLAGLLKWMDGHRWLGQAADNIYVVDYDGANPQALGPTLLPEGGFFSRDYNHLLTVQPRTGGEGVTLLNIDMRAGKDLP